MVCEHTTADKASDILRRGSQNLDVNLREVAHDQVRTGERPEIGSVPQRHSSLPG
jgi:hypothetical protein